MRVGRRADSERALAECREQAAETRHGIAMNNSLLWDAAIATAEGRFSDAKRIAAEAQEHGGRHNTIVALAYGAQILAARMEQGAVDKVINGLRQLDLLLDQLPAWRAMPPAPSPTPASTPPPPSSSSECWPSDDTPLPRDHSTPLAVRYLPEVCRQVSHGPAARTLLAHVKPWAGQLLVVTLGSSIEGAADRSIGHLLATLGLLDEADAAYRSAAQLELAVGFRPLAARTHYWHARMLLERGSRGDRELAEELLKDVISVTRELGMDLLAQQAAAHLETV